MIQQLLEHLLTEASGNGAYSKAPHKDAAPEVKQAVSRFKRLPLARRPKDGLLWWLLGGSTQNYKQSKREALYQGESKGQQKCGNCDYAYKKVAGTKHLLCSLVHGEIKANHWCGLWDKPDKELGPDYDG